MVMGSVPQLATRWGQILVAMVAAGVIVVVTKALPHLTVATTAMVVLREAVLIGGSLGLMRLLLHMGSVSAATMGWRRPTMRTLGWGLLCLLVSLVLSAAMVVTMTALGISQNASVLAAMAGRPIWILTLIALTAAISEEIIFRGIILNYVAAASGRAWIGAAVSLAAFALAHLSGWGWSQVLFAAVPGAVLTLFFLWKRDLGVCVVAHFLTDFLGLLGAAARFHHL